MIDFMQKLLMEKRWEVVKNNCELKEKRDKQDDMCIAIEELPSSGLKITIPPGVHSAIVEEKYKKSCDYLILIPDNDHIDLYFIELKTVLRPSPHPDIEGVPVKACGQILSTVPIWDYFVSAIKIYFDEEAKVIKKYKIRKHFVVIAENRDSKRDKQSKNQSEEYEVRYKSKNFKIILHSKNILMKNLKCR